MPQLIGEMIEWKTAVVMIQMMMKDQLSEFVSELATYMGEF